MPNYMYIKCFENYSYQSDRETDIFYVEILKISVKHKVPYKKDLQEERVLPLQL
jgi:hypothetical protein